MLSMYDYAQTNEDLVVSLTFSGVYNVAKGTVKDPDVILNSMNFKVDIVFIEIINGKIKMIKQGLGAFVNGGMKEDTKCADYNYFTSNFPLEKYVEEFKKSIAKKTSGMTAKIIKKHNKIVAKRK